MLLVASASGRLCVARGCVCVARAHTVIFLEGVGVCGVAVRQGKGQPTLPLAQGLLPLSL